MLMSSEMFQAVKLLISNWEQSDLHYLLLSMYSYCSPMYSYLCILRRGYPD